MAATSLQLPMPVPSPHTSRPGSASSQHSAAFAAVQRPTASPLPSPPLSPLPSPLTTPRTPADTASLPGKVLPSGRYEVMSVARYKQRMGCVLSCQEPGEAVLCPASSSSRCCGTSLTLTVGWDTAPAEFVADCCRTLPLCCRGPVRQPTRQGAACSPILQHCPCSPVQYQSN